MSGKYQQMLMSRLADGKKGKKLIQDHHYVEFLEGQLKKGETGIFLYDALEEKLGLMEGQIEILEKKVQNQGQNQQIGNKQQQEMINNSSSDQLNYIHQIYKELNGKIDEIGMNIRQSQQQKQQYDKMVDERVNYIVEMRLGDIEQRLRRSESMQNQRIEQIQNRLNEYINSFSKDVSNDIERLQDEFNSMKVVVDNERENNKQMVDGLQISRNRMDGYFQQLESQFEQLKKQSSEMQQNVGYLDDQFRVLSSKMGRVEVDRLKLMEQEIHSMNKAIDRLIENQHSNIKQIYSHSEDIHYLNASLKQKKKKKS